MRFLKMLLVLPLSLMTNLSFAQTHKAIEANLLKSFRKITYWDKKRANDKTYNPAFEDSLDVANTNFGKLLQHYAIKFPITISQKFTSLVTEHLSISTSADNLFRIYSWDMQGGGTMHEFANVFQYKTNAGMRSILDTAKQEGDFRSGYNKLYTVKAGSKVYYLAVYLFIESSRYYGEGIQCFSISQSGLNDSERIIKTPTGLKNQITYEADIGSVIDWKVRPSIYYNENTHIIKIPLVLEKGKITHKYISYKFNGKYFEKIKSK